MELEGNILHISTQPGNYNDIALCTGHYNDIAWEDSSLIYPLIYTSYIGNIYFYIVDLKRKFY